MKNHISAMRLVAAAVAILSWATAAAQRPAWLSAGLQDLTSTYVEAVSGDASTVAAARDKAAAEIVRRRNLTAGAEVRVQVSNGQITTTGDQKMVVGARILDEYVEMLDFGGYRVHLLVQTLKHPQFNYEDVAVTDRYDFSPRAFVPGMQQFYKGQTTKGIVFIAAEVACVGGIIVAESLRADYANKIGSTHNARQRMDYTDNANTMQNVRNVCIGAAAAVYVWNVIDAAVSRGARHVVLADATLTPFASADGVGLAFNYRF